MIRSSSRSLAVVLCGLLVHAIAGPPALLHAQLAPEPALVALLGVQSASRDRADVATVRGLGGYAALEVPALRRLGPLAVGLRADGGFDRQDIDAGPLSAISGDVETVRAGLSLRVAFSRRVAPYVIAGVGRARASTRIVVVSVDPDLPGASFSETSSTSGWSSTIGIGVSTSIQRALLWGEVRHVQDRLDGATPTTTAMLVGFGLPFGR
jgi:hypothetical protein